MVARVVARAVTRTMPFALALPRGLPVSVCACLLCPPLCMQHRWQQLKDWSESPSLPPVVTWLGGLFRPQSFLLAVLQTAARAVRGADLLGSMPSPPPPLPLAPGLAPRPVCCASWGEFPGVAVSLPFECVCAVESVSVCVVQ